MYVLVCMCVHELVCVFRCVLCCYVSTCVRGSSPCSLGDKPFDMFETRDPVPYMYDGAWSLL